VKNELSAKVWSRKQAMLRDHTVSYVACSKWLAGEAQKSSLLEGQRVVTIPNPIDTHIYHPKDKREAKRRLGLPEDRRIILFVSQRVTDRRKGMEFFMEAVGYLATQYPEMTRNSGIAILGGHAEEVADNLPIPAYPLGYVSDEQRIVDVYNAADVFVLPSLEDNLPNTLMEAMACGVPCVGFRVGGIPEMIDHLQNGYVARLRDAADLATGIHWVLFDTGYADLVKLCQHKVATNYSQQSVAVKYIEVYNQALALKHYVI
jgi:glycosyltransferase involved in cell wall biosynthesis